MSDYISELCKAMDLNLIYSNDDSLILTFSTINNIPNIIVHRLFFKCPKEIANSIIEYCYTEKNSEYNCNKIEKYAKSNIFLLKYVIDPPDDRFKSLLKRNPANKDMESMQNKLEAVEQDKSLNITEMEILSIKYTDFYGNSSIITPNEHITSSSDTIITLDIIINSQNS